MARFLNRLLNIFYVSQNKKALAPVVSDNEAIARFIFSSGHFAINTERVKYGAYLPAKDGETSIYRVTGLHINEIWNIGKDFVETNDRKLRACAKTRANEITRHSLSIVPETDDHYRHANIKAWPTEKDEKRMLAIEIAESSKLLIV